MNRFYYQTNKPEHCEAASKELRKLGRGHTIEDDHTISFATRPLGASYDILEKYGFEEISNDAY